MKKEAMIFLVLVSSLILVNSVSAIPFGDFGEFGNVLNLNDTVKGVVLERPYQNPIIIMGPLSFFGSDPAHARLKSISSSKFEVFVEEWDYLTKLQFGESAGYLAL